MVPVDVVFREKAPRKRTKSSLPTGRSTALVSMKEQHAHVFVVFLKKRENTTSR
jgi:hypothetical protein